jgi:hypothetical protein
MNDIREQELIRRLERLSSVKPTADATQTALDRVRRALLDSPAPQRFVREGRPMRSIGVAITLLGIAGLFVWVIFHSTTVGMAFADVEAAMKSARSVTFRQTVRTSGQPDEISRGMILQNGVWRSEEADGRYVVTDHARHRSLSVDPRKREARLMKGINLPRANLYEWTKNLPARAVARALSRKEINGKKVFGFVVKLEDADFLTGRPSPDLVVWADVTTRLPVRIEGKEANDKGAATEVILDQFVFDKPLDQNLFSLAPPRGYKLETQGAEELPNPPADPQLKDLIVTPLVGVGRVKFGMSRAEVERLLGTPDGAGFTPDQLNYASRGLFITVSRNEKFGVITIACVAQKGQVYRVRDFPGKTDKGIALGASSAEIVRAYGAPDWKETDDGSTSLSYHKLQAMFQLLDDKLVQMIFNRPRTAK